MTPLAADLARALDPDAWTALPGIPEGKGRGADAAILRATDGALVLLDLAGGRFTITGDHTVLDVSGWQHTISVAGDTPPARIAGHVRRRLLPWLDGAIPAARERAAKRERERLAREAAIDAILTVAPAQARRGKSYHGQEQVQWTRHGVDAWPWRSGAAVVDNDGAFVDLTMSHLPVDVAVAVVRVLAEHEPRRETTDA